MLEDLENRHDRTCSVAHDAQSLLGAAPEDSLDARHAEAVDNVGRQAKGDELRDFKSAALESAKIRSSVPDDRASKQRRARTDCFKRDPQVDVDEFSRLFVDEDVGAVAVAQSYQVTDHRTGSGAARVVKPHRVPGQRRLVLLGKEVSHDGVDLARRLGKFLADLLGRVARLPLRDLLPEGAEAEILGVVPSWIAEQRVRLNSCRACQERGN